MSTSMPAGNNLTTLPRGLLRDTDGLELLLLRGNPWYCGCNLRWLHTWLFGRGEAVTVRGLTCHGPEAVRGQALRDLSGLMDQCEGPPGGVNSVGGRGGGGLGLDTVTSTTTFPPTQGSLFTLRAIRPGLVMPLPPGGEAGGHASHNALELTVKPLSADSVQVTWLCPRPAPSFRLSWLRLGSSAALGSITETLVPGERQQYLLTQLTPRSHYLICLLPLRSTSSHSRGSQRGQQQEKDTTDQTPVCSQIETGEALRPEGGDGGEDSDTEMAALPVAEIIGGATALVSLILIFGIFCWYGQRTGYVSGETESYGVRGQRGVGKPYDDYVESGTKKDSSILEIRSPGFAMTPMTTHQPLQPKGGEDVTYVHTIFPSTHGNGTYRSNQSHNGITQLGHTAGYGTNQGYREQGMIPDIDYTYT